MKIKFVRLMLALILVISALGFTAHEVKAVTPLIIEETFTTDPFIVEDFCEFDLSVTALIDWRVMIYTDKEGNLEQALFIAEETDTFTANGVTLEGLPFHFSIHFMFNEAGELIKHSASGVVSRVPLPVGKVFLNAGRNDWLLHPGVDFLLTPDYGHTGDIDAFCAAFE